MSWFFLPTPKRPSHRFREPMGERRRRFSRFYHRRKINRHRHDRFHRLVLMSMLVWWAFAIGDVVVFTFYSFGQETHALTSVAEDVHLPVSRVAKKQHIGWSCVDVIVEQTGEIKTPVLLEDPPVSVFEQTNSWALFLRQDDRELRY